MQYMERIWTSELKEKIGQDVLLKGWVDVRRDHGKLVFLDLRDRGGKVQIHFFCDRVYILFPEAIILAENIQ